MNDDDVVWVTLRTEPERPNIITPPIIFEEKKVIVTKQNELEEEEN